MTKKSRKSQQREAVRELAPRLQSVQVGSLEVEARSQLRDVLIRGGLAVATAMLEDEVERLCGARYSRAEGVASRWGHAPGEAVLGGRKVKLERPRVRQGRREVALETYARFQAEDPLTERAVEQMLVGVSTRKYARSLEPVLPALEEAGTSKSAVSRRFVAKTAEQLEVALSEPSGDRAWAAPMVDGLHFHEHLVLIALGIDESGRSTYWVFVRGLRRTRQFAENCSPTWSAVAFPRGASLSSSTAGRAFVRRRRTSSGRSPRPTVPSA